MKEEKESTSKQMRLGTLMALVFLAWVSYWIITWCYFKDWKNGGVFGDSFGAINSLFSGLALAGIIYTVYLQKEELSLQRKELSDTRKEFKIQNRTLKKQRFESTFFSLITLHHAIVDKISIEVDKSTLKGAESIRHLNKEFRNKYSLYLKEKGNPKLEASSVTAHISIVMSVFTEFYKGYDEHLSQCFKNFITLAKMAKESKLISDSDREFYFSIIATQIHPCEMILLFYYFNVGDGYRDKALFTDLKLTRKMDPNLLADRNHFNIFDPPETIKDIFK